MQVAPVDTPPLPVLSVVVCTCNRAPVLANAIAALLKQVHDTPSYEVVVVDNNSSDATREVVAQFGGGVSKVTQRITHDARARKSQSPARCKVLPIRSVWHGSPRWCEMACAA